MASTGFPKTLDMSDPAAIHRFIGGRRRYNSWRQFNAILRRREVAQLLSQDISQTEIAERLGVHRSTICRDVAWLYEQARNSQVCPCCGQSFLIGTQI